MLVETAHLIEFEYYTLREFVVIVLNNKINRTHFLDSIIHHYENITVSDYKSFAVINRRQ